METARLCRKVVALCLIAIFISTNNVCSLENKDTLRKPLKEAVARTKEIIDRLHELQAVREIYITEEHRRRYNEWPANLSLAPGRLPILGDHTDYDFNIKRDSLSGNEAVPHNQTVSIALGQNMLVTGSRNSDNMIRAYSITYGTSFEIKANDINWDTLDFNDPYETRWGSDEYHWVRYLLGAYQRAVKEGFIDKNNCGLNLVLEGNVPLAAGLSSSASLDCGLSFAFSDLFGWGWHLDNIGKARLALFARRVEHAAGMSCGFLDQFSSVFGKEGYAMIIDYGWVTIVEDKLERGMAVEDSDIIGGIIKYVPLKPLFDAGYKINLVHTLVHRPPGGLVGTAYNIRRQELLWAGARLAKLMGKDWKDHVACWELKDLLSVEERWLEGIDGREINYAQGCFKRARYVLSAKERNKKAIEILGELEKIGGDRSKTESLLNQFFALINEEEEGMSSRGDYDISDAVTIVDGKITGVADNTPDILPGVLRRHGARASKVAGGGGGGVAVEIVLAELDTPERRSIVTTEVAAAGIKRHGVEFMGEAVSSNGARRIVMIPRRSLDENTLMQPYGFFERILPTGEAIQRISKEAAPVMPPAKDNVWVLSPQPEISGDTRHFSMSGMRREESIALLKQGKLMSGSIGDQKQTNKPVKTFERPEDLPVLAIEDDGIQHTKIDDYEVVIYRQVIGTLPDYQYKQFVVVYDSRTGKAFEWPFTQKTVLETDIIPTVTADDERHLLQIRFGGYKTKVLAVLDTASSRQLLYTSDEDTQHFIERIEMRALQNSAAATGL